MANKRQTDPITRSWFRTDRVTEDKGVWYFHTREKTTEGPFPSMFDAQNQLERYINVQTSGMLVSDKKYSMTLF